MHTKNYFLIVAVIGVLLIAMPTVNAQGKSSLALRMGLNNAKILHTELHTKSDIYAGLALSVKLSEMYVLQPEITYLRQGGKSKRSTANDITINYISIGLTNKLFTQSQRFHFMLGPSLAFNYDDNLFYLTNDSAEKFKITPIDLCIMGGVGFNLGTGIDIECRYKQGLIDLDFKDDGAYGSSTERAQLNKVIQIGINYTFNF
ncbi:PorT family protein [Flavobacteriaceae bacterium F08102]|nr:PorT family protein [Flavobacteriaceae bacterium F08102]